MTHRTILFLLDSLQTGGAELSLLKILSSFKKYTPVVVTLYSKNSELKLKFEESGIQVVQLNLKASILEVFKTKNIAHQLLGINPTIIHSTLFRSDLLARSLARHFNGLVINSLVNNVYCLRRYRMEPWSRKFKLAFYQLLDLITARKADFFISNSVSIARSYSAALFIPENKIKVIYRGREIPDASVNAQRDYDFKLDQSSSELVFLNISRLLQRKDHQTLILAFNEFQKTNPAARLIICGEGPERAALEKLIQTLNLNPKVQLVGTVLDASPYYQSAHFFVFPSRFEGLPGVLIEAMLARLPIIASDIPENKECISEDMALFHKAGDVHDLANTLRDAVKITNWQDRTNQAYQRAVELFDVEKIASKYEAVYDELILKSNKNAMP